MMELLALFHRWTLITSLRRPHFIDCILIVFTECFNQTLVKALSKLVNEEANDWDDHRDAVAFAYRTNVQVSTKRSPFELLCGICATLPAQLKDDHNICFIWELSVNVIMQRAETIETLLPPKRKAAQENISSKQTKQRKQWCSQRGAALLPSTPRNDIKIWSIIPWDATHTCRYIRLLLSFAHETG